MLEIFHQLKLHPQTELHYMFHIEEFLRAKNPQSPWLFRVREDGKVALDLGNKYWINERERRAAIEYPHLDEIKMYLQALSQQEKDFHSSTTWQKYLRKNKIVTAMLRPGTDPQYSVLKQDTLSVDRHLTYSGWRST